MYRIYNHYVDKTRFILFIVELLVLLASVYLGASVRFFDPIMPTSNQFIALLPEAGVFAIVMASSMLALGMYQLEFKEDIRHIFLRLMPPFVLGLGLMMLIFYLVPSLYFGRGILVIVTMIAWTTILLTRVFFYNSSRLSLLESRILILGTGKLAEECYSLSKKHFGSHNLNIIGFVSTPDEENQVASPHTSSSQASSLQTIPLQGSLFAMANQYKVNEIVVAVQNRRNGSCPIEQLLECKLNGVNVIDAASFFEREMSQIRVDSLQPSWLVFGGGFDQGAMRTNIKRVFDILASIILLIATLPIMLMTALCIFLEDRSPIFYSQERVGLDGQVFRVLKFRSMRNDAEKFGTPQWATEADPRVTKIGNIIRKLRIDELPQIINVLKGEMSFVGPRPERPYFVEQLCEQVPYYNLRHSVKPGITGWAQVLYQYGASVEDSMQKLQYDLYYVKNNSLFLDLIILIDTVQVVLSGKGSR
ncbi:MAG: TIGR03013 family PEP-CTERM/XrtA system glycosyltransferase [Methylophilaceae bacterium]|nr:TIGR03013 family PEP-CTERM/XrtA system glycosyltransferase [Methylophilaceae bacterium]